MKSKPLDSLITQWIVIILIFLGVVGNVILVAKYITTKPEPLQTISGSYKTDGTYVYLSGVLIIAADPTTFKVVSSCGCYAVDNHHVYYDGQSVYAMNPATFVAINDDYVKDANAVYYDGKIVTWADPHTFSPVEGSDSFMKDAKHIYQHGQIYVSTLDPLTFDVMGDNGYVKDSSHVYFGQQLVVGADAATFVDNGNDAGTYDAYDKNTKYLNGRAVK